MSLFIFDILVPKSKFEFSLKWPFHTFFHKVQQTLTAPKFYKVGFYRALTFQNMEFVAHQETFCFDFLKHTVEIEPQTCISSGFLIFPIISLRYLRPTHVAAI